MIAVIKSWRSGNDFIDGLPRVILEIKGPGNRRKLIELPGDWIPGDLAIGTEYSIDIMGFEPPPIEEEE